jgi:lysophospholipase L1-like esterase
VGLVVSTIAVAVTAAIALTPAARADDTPAYRCHIQSDIAKLDHPLSRVGSKLAAGEAVTIVAFGSSSTAGSGASSIATNYPSRLAVELKQRFPNATVTVLNRGVGGEEAADMLKRIDSAVFAVHPDLVLWQVGTNAVLRDSPLPPAERQINDGVERMKAAGTDVVLIDPQFAPKVIARPETPGMVDLLAHTAKEYNVDVFRRYDLMRRWVEDEGIPFTTFISPDRLHMNDWSYACVAKQLAVAIAGAVERPVASASRHPVQPVARLTP